MNTPARVADATPTSEASLKSSVTAAKWQDAEKGEADLGRPFSTRSTLHLRAAQTLAAGSLGRYYKSVLFGCLISSFAGKLNHQQVLQLVADSTKDSVPQGLSKLLLTRRPGDARRLVDILHE